MRSTLHKGNCIHSYKHDSLRTYNDSRHHEKTTQLPCKGSANDYQSLKTFMILLNWISSFSPHLNLRHGWKPGQRRGRRWIRCPCTLVYRPFGHPRCLSRLRNASTRIQTSRQNILQLILAIVELGTLGGSQTCCWQTTGGDSSYVQPYCPVKMLIYTHPDFAWVLFTCSLGIDKIHVKCSIGVFAKTNLMLVRGDPSSHSLHEFQETPWGCCLPSPSPPRVVGHPLLSGCTHFQAIWMPSWIAWWPIMSHKWVRTFPGLSAKKLSELSHAGAKSLISKRTPPDNMALVARDGHEHSGIRRPPVTQEKLLNDDEVSWWLLYASGMVTRRSKSTRQGSSLNKGPMHDPPMPGLTLWQSEQSSRCLTN